MGEVQSLRLGPIVRDWIGPDGKEPLGDCDHCGGQCDDKCGTHASGCFFGGPTEMACFWMIADGCDRYHGDGDGSRLYPKAGE